MITSDDEYQSSLQQLHQLMLEPAEESLSQQRVFDNKLAQVIAYEALHWTIDSPSAEQAKQFRAEQLGQATT